MTYVVFVHVLNGRKDLLHYHGGLVLGQIFLLCDVVEEFAPLAKFLDKEYPFLVLINLKKFHNIWMIQLLHYGDFVFSLLNILDGLLPDCLNGPHIKRLSIFCQVNYPLGSGTQPLRELVVLTDVL